MIFCFSALIGVDETGLEVSCGPPIWWVVTAVTTEKFDVGAAVVINKLNESAN